MQALEIVTFRLKGADRTAFLAANGEVDSWLKRQPGFVHRQLAEEPDGTWSDLVTWASRDEALGAAEQMGKDMGSLSAMSMIDPDSVVMRHADIQATLAL